MKIVYMGTPEFAVPALNMLCEKGYEVALVVTQPDKARNRGKKIQFPPVKQEAISRGIPVAQPERFKNNDDFLQQIRSIAPDLIVVAAYGKLLPCELLNIPRYGCVNIHASLLPKYRGAAPIQHSILDGEKETGITLMYMAEGMDTGDMIASKRTPIDQKTAAMLYEELADLGGKLLLEIMPEIEKGTASRVRQDDSKATYAPMIFKKDGHIDFSKNPEEIERLIRGLNPWPGAYAEYGEQTVKFWEAEILDEAAKEPDGTIVRVSGKGLDIAAGGKTLRVTRLQMPGKKAMTVGDFLKGNQVRTGDLLK